MKKTYKNTWGKSLLAGLLLMATGGAEAQAASVTFDLNGPSEALGSLEVWYNYTQDLTSRIENKKLTVEFEGQASYAFSVPDTYELKVEAPEGVTENVDYMIVDYGSAYGSYSVDVVVTDACDGKVFKVTIPGGDEEPVEMAPASMLSPEVDANGEVSEDVFGTAVYITYDFQVLTMLSEKYVPATIVNPAGDEFDVTGMLIPYDPSIGGTLVNPDDVPKGTTLVSFNIMKAARPDFPNSYDILMGKYVMTIPAGVVANEEGLPNPAQTLSFTVTESTKEPTVVTFDFSGDPAGMATLQVIDYTTYDYIQDNIVDDKLAVSFEFGFAQYTFAVDSEYVIEINPPADLVEMQDYYVSDGMLDSDMGIYGVTVQLTDGANGSVFNVNVHPAKYDGVGSVEAGLGKETVVHDLTGKRVLHAGHGESFDALEPGLYIINGRKVIIRK